MTAGDTARRRFAFLAFALFTLGWGFIWAVGLTIVYNGDAAWGWIIASFLFAIFVDAFLRRNFPVTQPGRRSLVLYPAWLAGGIVASQFAGYDVAAGMVTMAAVGGLATGWVITKAPLRALAFGVVCTIAARFGDLLASTWGKNVGQFAGSMIHGKTAPFIAWGVAWGIGGMLSGAICGWLLLLEARREIKLTAESAVRL